MEKIIVIGGMARSGTNLTRRIIGSHSQIAIPPAEFQFFKKHHQNKSVEQILSNKRLADWNVDFSDLYSLEPAQVYTKALQRYASQAGKRIAGEKSPFNEFYLDTIEHWLTDFDLKFILMVRNPFDVLASYKHKPFGDGFNPDDDSWVPTFVKNWHRSVCLGLAKSHAHPEHYFVLRYEDLTRDTAAKTKELCAFFGVEFEQERMLNLTDFASKKNNTSFTENLEAKPDAKIYAPPSRKSYLSKTEIAQVCKTCGELAWALGYQDEDFRPGPPEHKVAGGLRQRFGYWSKALGRRQR
jgi:hypothetical protein